MPSATGTVPGVEILQKYNPQIRSLRDVQLSQLIAHRAELDETDFKRCRFIVEENQRLLDGCDFLKQHKLEAFGALMYASHTGLSRDYEVSCPESDFLVERIRLMKGILGARQMGGGFGGCIITLVEKNATENFIAGIQDQYQKQFSITPDCFIMNISEGAQILEPSAQG